MIKSKQRLGYIDSLRGFAMLLVVFGHIIYHSFNLETNSYKIVSSIHLPLFFYISGFVVNKSFITGPVSLCKNILAKVKSLLIPACVVGGGIFLLYNGR